jgi:hypothetical protein
MLDGMATLALLILQLCFAPPGASDINGLNPSSLQSGDQTIAGSHS